MVFTLQLVFTLRCKHEGIIPPNLRLKCPINTSKARDIVNKARKELLGERIRVTTNKIKGFNDNFERAKGNILDRLPSNDGDIVKEFFSTSQTREYESSKERLKTKMADWRKKVKTSNFPSGLTVPKEVDLSGEQLKRWVINLSKRPLKDAETTVLAKGLNFAVTSPVHPIDDLIVVAEEACKLVPPSLAHELRPKLSSIISSAKPPIPNISKEESQALQTLAKDNDILVMPADKGRSTVVLDKEEYTQKVRGMLSDHKTYLKLDKDPTARYKSKLVAMLAKLRKDGKITETQKRYLYPTSETIPRLYCTPKIHKPGNPLRPIVDYTGSIGYNLSRSLADLLAPITGKTIHHVENSKALVKELKDVQLTEEETFISFDVVSLFTNTPIHKALDVIRKKLEEDRLLKQRTLLAVDDIMQLLEFVLTTTYFKFDGQLYQQKFGTAMGSPVSPIVANLYMEDLEQRAIATAPEPMKPRFWKRYVDDVIAIIRKGMSQSLNDHLNTIDETGNIKFTNEEMEDNSIPFLDTRVTRKENGRLKTVVYRKKTHTNQYLNFNSHHPVVHKLGVVRTLLDRVNTVVTEEEDKENERGIVKDALTTCGYPVWTFKETERRIQAKADQSANKNRNAKGKDKSRGLVVVPYIKGLSERISRTLRSVNIATAFKPYRTIRNVLVHPKDKIDRDDTTGCVYQIDCANCEDTYIGETGRKFGTRLKEHQTDVNAHSQGVSTRASRASTSGDHHKSAITDHMVDHNHVPNWQDAKVVTKEDNWKRRQIRESIAIRRSQHTMNRDEGSYHLSHVYDSLLKPTRTHTGDRRQGAPRK